jgi:TetR/AcrR family transcriptional regulator, transcriptional repressor for nem operon
MIQAQAIHKFTNTRQQIIDTAKNIMLGKGFAAVGLNEILTQANVPKGSFYHYFKSKEQFGDALLEDYLEGYLAQLDAKLSSQNGSVSLRLFAYFQNWLDTQTADTTHDKCLVVKLSAEVTDLSETMRITLKRGTDRIINRIAECVQEGIDNGEFPAHLDARLITNEIYYMWIGATLLTKVNRSREALESAMSSLKNRLDSLSLNMPA